MISVHLVNNNKIISRSKVTFNPKTSNFFLARHVFSKHEREVSVDTKMMKKIENSNGDSIKHYEKL